MNVFEKAAAEVSADQKDSESVDRNAIVNDLRAQAEQFCSGQRRMANVFPGREGFEVICGFPRFGVVLQDNLDWTVVESSDAFTVKSTTKDLDVESVAKAMAIWMHEVQKF